MNKIVVSKKSIDGAIKRMASEISSSFPKKEKIVIMAMGNESIEFATNLAKKLSLNVIFDVAYVDVTKRGSKILTQYHKLSSYDLTDKNVVLVTSSAGDGIQLSKTREKLFQTYDVKSVTFCSLLKQKNSKIYLHHLGFSIKEDAGKLFGYGMSNRGTVNFSGDIMEVVKNTKENVGKD